MMDIHKRQRGKNAETQACEFLEKHGLQLLQKNYTCYFGEVDLIMKDKNNDIVFVEVRSRQFDHCGYALQSITPKKEKKILKTAQYYLQQKKWLDKMNCRFDIIAISYANRETEIDWITHAFSMVN